MAYAKEAHVPMAQEEYDQLERIARSRQTSVAELIRVAVRERYLNAVAARQALVGEIAAMDLEVEDWESLRDELEEAHGDGVS